MIVYTHALVRIAAAACIYVYVALLVALMNRMKIWHWDTFHNNCATFLYTDM